MPKRALRRAVTHKRRLKRNKKRLRQIFNKGNEKKKNQTHLLTKKIIDLCVKEGTGTIVIGKIKGQKQNINLGRKNNRKFHYIQHAIILEKLKYKAEEAGIRVIVQNEAYTSKCSWPDDEAVRKHSVYKGKRINTTKAQRKAAALNGLNIHSDRLFRSSNGSLYHSDLNGAANILRKYDPSFRVTLEGLGPLLSPNTLVI